MSACQQQWWLRENEVRNSTEIPLQSKTTEEENSWSLAAMVMSTLRRFTISVDKKSQADGTGSVSTLVLEGGRLEGRVAFWEPDPAQAPTVPQTQLRSSSAATFASDRKCSLACMSACVGKH